MESFIHGNQSTDGSAIDKMSSYSDLELSIVAIFLSIIAVYLHVPIKDIKITAWLRQLGKIGGSSTTSGPGVSKDFVELMRESVSPLGNMSRFCFESFRVCSDALNELRERKSSFSMAHKPVLRK